ncbi:CoA transferase [Rhodococcus sp. 27YEA15]|uniref:CoA transferase n=1 Tax=Rhodococcus sp. 27YEA15 TaxID=3156259 RepID=UPI003C7A6DED
MSTQSSFAGPTVTTWLTDSVRQEFEAAGYWTDETWVELAEALGRETPRAPAVVDEQGSLDHGEVLHAARRLSAYMYHRGVRSGDVVTVIMPNWREFVVVHMAVGLLGGVVNPLLPLVDEATMQHVFGTSRSRFVFAADEHRRLLPATLAVRAAERCESVIEVVRVRGGEGTLDDILAESWEDRVEVPRWSPDARAWDTVTFTSGTEALPKGVVHTHQTTMYGLRAYVGDRLGLTAGDVVFMPSPICHASGMEWGLRTAIYVGAPLVLQDRWDPEVALDLIDTHGCTYTLAATPFIVDLLSAASTGPVRGQSLRYVASGGAAIPRHLFPRVRETFGAELLAVFGASESYVTTATTPGSADLLAMSDGNPLTGIEVAILDEEGDPVPAGSAGEIVTRGPQLFLGYLGDPDLTRRSFRGEWYRFGDLGLIDDNGMLHVTGRIKDIVIRGGENISVREIEEALAGHPSVDGVAVVGYPDHRLGERCCAVVVPAPGHAPDLRSLTQFLLEQGIATFKLPERLELIDALPMTATGKVRKADLRSRLAERHTPGALAGIRVLDVSMYLPGPYASLMLADLGADVIQVEPPGGDLARSVEPRVGSDSALHNWVGRNKRSRSLDLKTEEGRDVFFELLREADIVVEGFTPGVADRLGIGYRQCVAVKPDIVYCSVSGAGNSDPSLRSPGNDLTYQARSGFLDQSRDAAGDPVPVAPPVTDITAGLHAAVGILAALHHRDRTGEGQHVDVSLLGAALSLVAPQVIKATSPEPVREEDDHNRGHDPAYRTYGTSDGLHVAIGAFQHKFFVRLCELVGRPELPTLRYSDPLEVAAELETEFASRTRAEWSDLLGDADVCYSPVNSIRDVLADKQIVLRQDFVDVSNYDGVVTPQLRNPIRMSGTPPQMRTSASPVSPAALQWNER